MSSEALIEITERLRDEVQRLSFAAPTSHVYNPLVYAWVPHLDYLQKYGAKTGRVVLFGMNPGPFGMAQTGVPFGEVAHVRDWMGVRGVVGRPEVEHPKRPILGFECPRSEVSGRRLWGWAKERFGPAEAFFERFFVLNYCPLVFMEGPGGRNRTPDKLPAEERKALYAVCDRALRAAVEVLRPARVLGVGRFAERRAREVLGASVPIGTILHPSPASPAANRGWAQAAERQLVAQGLIEPDPIS